MRRSLAHTSAPTSAFTLIELLVVIAIIAILASLLLPSLSRAKQRAQGASCLNSGKQMMFAMIMYVDENNDLFPPNPDDGNTIAGHNWVGGQSGVGGAQEFNPDVLMDPEHNLLLNYLKKDISMFRCPGDRRQGLYQGTNSALAGQTVPAIRTFSMNQAVGTICQGYDDNNSSPPHSGIPNRPVNGPWLNNQYRDHRRNQPWLTYGKLTSITRPGPSGLWVLLDENASGLNDAAFAMGMEKPGWYDWPGSYHDQGCGLAFADGHSETHRWKSSTTKFGSGKVGNGSANLADWPDWQWLRDRTSANSTN